MLDNDVLDHKLWRLEQLVALFAAVLCRLLLADMWCSDLFALPAKLASAQVKVLGLTLADRDHHTRRHQLDRAMASTSHRCWLPTFRRSTAEGRASFSMIDPLACDHLDLRHSALQRRRLDRRLFGRFRYLHRSWHRLYPVAYAQYIYVVALPGNRSVRRSSSKLIDRFEGTIAIGRVLFEPEKSVCALTKDTILTFRCACS